MCVVAYVIKETDDHTTTMTLSCERRPGSLTVEMLDSQAKSAI